MLDRIKKRQLDGFKEFVINMETTGATTRSQIFTAGILEDPIFMDWVMKNIRTFDDFLKLSSDDIATVLQGQDQTISIFAKALFGNEAEIKNLEGTIPQLLSRFKDELSYIKEVTPQERDSAKFFIMKAARKFQMDESINGFQWKLPPMDVFYPKQYKDGPGQIVFDSGTVAAEGEFTKGKRTNSWKHYYENGKLLAEGDYFDGLKTNVWVFYWSNGNIKSQGKYKSDLKHGFWKEWDRHGTLTEVEYVEGVKKAAAA